MLFFLPDETEGSQRPSLIPESLHPCASSSGVTLPVSRRHTPLGKTRLKEGYSLSGKFWSFGKFLSSDHSNWSVLSDSEWLIRWSESTHPSCHVFLWSKHSGLRSWANFTWKLGLFRIPIQSSPGSKWNICT